MRTMQECCSWYTAHQPHPATPSRGDQNRHHTWQCHNVISLVFLKSVNIVAKDPQVGVSRWPVAEHAHAFQAFWYACARPCNNAEGAAGKSSERPVGDTSADL
jgi:hypothetical protein